MDPGPCGVPSAVSGLSGLSDPESQDRPCLIVEDSQPDSSAIEDDPESSYRALLTRRLSSLRTTGGLELISGSQNADQSQPPIFEMNPSLEESEVLDVSEGRGRCEQMDSRGESQSLQHEESVTQFGFLELSQSQDFGPEPVQDQIRTRPNDESLRTQSRPSPPVPAQALPHSQDRVLNQDQDQLLSSQEDLFDKMGPVVRSSSPSRLALLQLSGCAPGTLVHNSLSQSSVDFVAPTPENLTPMIVPSSPTEHDEPMDQSEHRDPSTAVCDLLRPLSVPSQLELSHDVFVPTQSQIETSSPAPQTSSPAPQTSSHAPQTSSPAPQTSSPAPQTSSPAPQTSSPAPQTCSLNLCINTEVDDEEATQIEALDQDTDSHKSQQSQQSQQSQSLHLSADSQNRISRFSQEAKNHNSRPSSQENQNKNATNATSAKANSQPPEFAPDFSSLSQMKALNKDHEKMTNPYSQKVQVNSQPAGSAGVRIVPESQPEIMNVEDEKKSTNGSAPQPQTAVKNVNHGKCSQNRAEASSEPHGSAPRPALDSQAKVLNVNNEKMTETFSLKAKASSQPVASTAIMIVSDSQALMKAHSQPTGPSANSTKPALRPASRPDLGVPGNGLSPRRPQDGAAGAEQQSLGVLELSQSEMLTSTEQGAKMSAAGKDKRDGKSLDSSGELSFHFTLPKEDELIGRSVSATPPHMSQLKQTLRHSTPIEVNSPSQRSDLSVGSDIITGAEGADGKLSLRMKLVTPVEESSERFSLQRPSLSDGVSVCPSSSSAPHSASVFSRVRHVHRAPSGQSCAHRSPSPQSHSQSDASSQLSTANEDAEKLQGVAEARGLDRTDTETPPPRHAGPSHRRHVRTIQEVRTTVTRIITDTFYEDGKEVERSVREESDDPVVNFQVMDVSPSRTVGSMTSGDLADISSSTGATGTSSGPTERPHLLPPPSRGGKARGGGARRGSPVSPRGNRRGRPPARPAPPSAPPAGSSPPPQDSSSFVGLRVVAKWSSNGYFYSGRITQDLGVHQGGTGPGLGSGPESGPESGPGENRFKLRFDDGYECELWARDILLCDPIPLESEVTGLNQDQTLCTGEVVAYRSDGPELQYCLQPPRGQQRVWFPRSAVILSLEQGNRLREKHSLGPYAPPPLLGHAADISLDNLVEGKRKRRGGQSGLSTPPRTPRTPRQKPSPGPGPRQGLSPGSKRKLSSDHPPAAKRGRRAAVQQVSVLNTSDSDPAPSDPAPSDVSCDLAATQGPRPKNAALFEGFVFLLTSSSERDRLSNRLSNHEELVQTGPYNKSYTESQLQSGGGIILKEFNHQQCQAAYQPLLIADQHCCNRPYLLSLVSGVPCVSHLWVRDCCRDDTLHNYRSYLLPAGRGPGGGVKEWRPRCKPFQELKVLLLLKDHIQFWTELIQLGGGTAVVRTPEELPDLPPDAADVLVSGPVSGLALPQVSVDWIIDSVVCGEPLDFSGFSSAVDSSSS